MTDQKATLETTVALLEATLEAANDAILVVDLDRQVIRYNRHFLAMMGLSAGELERRGVAAIAAAIADTDDHGALRFEDGRVVHRFEAPYRFGGAVMGQVLTYRDVTDAVRREEHRHQSQRLEAIGRLAGGVAHDLNNALTAIAGYTELALNALDERHPARPDVREIRRAAERAESVTRQLLAFSRKQVLAPRLFSLGDSVANLGRLLSRLLGASIDLETTVEPDLPPIYGDAGQIEQAIVNLAVNARDAMPDGGRLSLSVAVATIDEAAARSRQPMPAGRYVEASVGDTGHGMPPDVQAHIFEPFYTTKEAGKGTGLGLAMVYGTVQQSGGFIFVESEVGRGTIFRMYFPPATVASEASASKSGDAAQRTILVVEDESPVRTLVVSALHQDGYRVLQAMSARDALEIADTDGAPIDLLLTDARMPGMSGLELATRLVEKRPTLRVMIMSGYTDEPPDVPGACEPVAVLAKPFTPRQLRQRIREAIGRQ